jgi:hypothetical protein
MGGCSIATFDYLRNPEGICLTSLVKKNLDLQTQGSELGKAIFLFGALGTLQRRISES